MTTYKHINFYVYILDERSGNTTVCVTTHKHNQTVIMGHSFILRPQDTYGSDLGMRLLTDPDLLAYLVLAIVLPTLLPLHSSPPPQPVGSGDAISDKYQRNGSNAHGRRHT